MSVGRVVFTDKFKATVAAKLGVAAMRRNSFVEAIRHFDEAIALEPDYPLPHWNKATSLLSLGDYVTGFQEFEWRWKMYDWRWGLLGDDIYRVRQLPQWRGQPLNGKHLLFYWEMGYGDAIQQLRYVNIFHALGARVTALMCQPLVRLAERTGARVIESVPEDTSEFDFRCSLFGVMAALAQTVRGIPGRPYLSLRWESSGGGKLGIAWSGRTQKESLDQLLLHLDLRGFQLQSLQPGHVTSFMHPLPPGDFLDTAHVIAQMEHVVTVDTAVAHLAGAMGHPSAHVLIPYCSDWRWHFGHAWYQTLQFYRQKRPGDWAEPFAMLNANLRGKHANF
jgi:hypothetical protein